MPCGTRVCGQLVSAPPWRSRRRRVARRLLLERESAARKVCSACREREEDVRSALPGPSLEHATGSEQKGALSSRCACIGTSRLFRRLRPPGRHRLEGTGPTPASVCGARPGCVLSLRRWSHIRLPLPRRTPSCTHLENMFSSFLPPADSRQIPPDGRTPLPADRPSASRSRAGRGTRLFRYTFLREGRGGGRITDHGTEGCHMLPDVLGM